MVLPALQRFPHARAAQKEGAEHEVLRVAACVAVILLLALLFAIDVNAVSSEGWLAERLNSALQAADDVLHRLPRTLGIL